MGYRTIAPDGAWGRHQPNVISPCVRDALYDCMHTRLWSSLTGGTGSQRRKRRKVKTSKSQNVEKSNIGVRQSRIYAALRDWVRLRRISASLRDWGLAIQSAIRNRQLPE